MKTFSRVISLWALLAATVNATSQTPGEKLWSFAADQGLQSSPAIGTDGTIYFGSDGGILFALNRDGSIKWEYKTGGSIVSSPAIGPDGTIHVGSTDRVLYALSPEGRLKWLASPGSAMVASPAIAADGTIYVGTVFNSLVAISSGGTRLWVFQAGGNLVSSPVIGADGSIYIGCRDNKLYALGPEGKLKWTFTTSAGINASAAIGADGTLYVGSLDHKLFAVNPDGTKRWEFVTGDAIRSSAAVASDGTIYVGSDDGKLYAVTPAGVQKWAFTIGQWLRSSPAISSEGTIFLGAYDKQVHAVNPDGTEKWRFATSGHVSSSPAIGADGTVYIGSWDKNLYALKGSGPPASAPWPMFRGDPARTGRAALQQVVPRIQLGLANLIKTLHAPATIRLSADLSGIANSQTKVEFYQGRSKIGEANAAPYGLIRSNVLVGTYSFTAKAVLASGQSIDSKPLEVLVNAAPVAAKPKAGKTAKTSSISAPPMPDKTKPFVAIVTPGRDSHVAAEEISVRGTASDNVGVARVEYQLGKGPFTMAGGTDNWQVTLRLAPGENTLLVRAIDQAGNQSNVARRKIIYSAKLPLQVKVQGDGIIRTSLEDRELEVGKTYSLTAEPRPGMAFAGWTGSIQTNTPTVTFVMAENFFLEANFVPNRFAAIEGEYTGLIDPPGPANPDAAGIISITTTEKGAYRGQLQFGGASHALKGQFDATGTLRQTIERARKPPLNLVLRLDLASDPDLITGSVSDGTITTEILGDRLVYDGRERKAPETGRFTLTMAAKAITGTAPQGDGFGQLAVDARGVVHFEGTLGDGTPVKQAVPLTKNGVWPVYVPLYEGQGSLSGWVRFKSQSYGDLFGQLTWIKPAGKDTSYPAGFTNQVSVLGSAYTAPGRDGNAAFRGGRGLLRLNSANLKELLIGGIGVDADYKVTIPEGTESNLKLRIAPQTGLISGSFTHPVTGAATPLQGAWLQKQGIGSGFFASNGTTGHVLLSLATRQADNRPGR